MSTKARQPQVQDGHFHLEVNVNHNHEFKNPFKTCRNAERGQD